MTRQSSEAWLRALKMTSPILENPSVTLPEIVCQLARRFSTSPAFLSSTGSVSYCDFGERVTHYARWALSRELRAGDVVCLFMENCPDYMAIWLGITRIGAVVSLMNTNLRGAALEHSITLARPRHIIIGAGMHAAFATVRRQVDSGIICWTHGEDAEGMPRADGGENACVGPEARLYRPPSIRDTALYIYTSGTTGLPKAAAVSHFRLMQWSHWFAGMMDTGANDRMYNCLPMYHSVGGIVATGATLIGGGAIVLRERFSANDFWTDIASTDCTLFQYTGELCRFLLKHSPQPDETRHRLRLCCGNGLGGAIWHEFQNRFHIPRILEFYAATEGNLALYNCEGRVGSIGRIPPFLRHRFAMELVRCEVESGQPCRDDDGYCLRVDPGETGHAISRISGDAASLNSRFEGYTDVAASGEKILRNVFSAGDEWYLTGDLMRKDKDGYYYFVDRVGDTFRWKSENVSTTETAEIIAACEGVTEAVVYGVSVPHAEGRAGMAAIVVDKTFALGDFHRALTERLPSYARPLFLRIRTSMDLTGTFKPQKQHLRREGYNPSTIADTLYFNDRERNAFVALDTSVFERIQNGDMRL
jgi:fatty-acyl-CoA synthase